MPLKRTPKLLAGMCCCTAILDVEWLMASAKQKIPLNTHDFLLRDAAAETKWNFTIPASIARRIARQSTSPGKSCCCCENTQSSILKKTRHCDLHCSTHHVFDFPRLNYTAAPLLLTYLTTILPSLDIIILAIFR